MILILGYGNTLRGDDGYGPAVVTALMQCPLIAESVLKQKVRLQSARQLLPEDAELVASAELVIFIDAAVHGQPGAVQCTELAAGGEMSATGGSITHSFSPCRLLSLAGSVYGYCPPAVIFTCPGESFDLVERLSRPVVEAVKETVGLIGARLTAGANRLSERKFS